MKRKPLSIAQRKAAYSKCNGRCAYCGTPIEYKQMQVDHVVPIELGHIVMAEGGDPNNLKNCLPACRSCNYIKSSMMPEKFRRYISGLIESLARDSVTYRNAVRFGMVEEKPHTPQFYFEKLGVKTAGYLSDFDEMYRKNVVRLEKEEEAE